MAENHQDTSISHQREISLCRSCTIAQSVCDPLTPVTVLQPAIKPASQPFLIAHKSAPQFQHLLLRQHMYLTVTLRLEPGTSLGLSCAREGLKGHT